MLALVVVALTIAAAAGFSWLAFSPSAAQWLVYQLVAAFDGRLAVGAVEGSLAQGISIRNVAYREEGTRVEIDHAEAAWQWSALLDFHAQFRRLALGRVTVTTAPSKERTQLPASLALPLRVSVDKGRIDRLIIVLDTQNLTLEDIDFRGSAGQARHLLEFFLKEIAPSVYNAAIADAQTYLRDRVADLEGACYAPEFGYWPKATIRKPR